jgi:hypothetical protein
VQASARAQRGLIVQRVFDNEVFGLMNQSIQNEVVHHGSIPQIWWDDSIPHISTKQLRPCSFVPDWWVGTIPDRIASLIYINFN